jgi:hypothetical protein
MKITIFGTGFVGATLLRELAARGHDIFAISRSGRGGWPASVASDTGDVHDASFVARVTADADVVVVALPALSDDGGIAAGVAALLPVLAHGIARLGVVGGSAVLPMYEGGPRLGDTDRFPAALRDRVAAHQEALDELTAAPAALDWFEVVPAADFGPHHPGTRRGTYRTSRTALVSDDHGQSAIGVEDYAIAFADEIETPTTHRAWLTVGY